jgi:hypothetical protein
VWLGAHPIRPFVAAGIETNVLLSVRERYVDSEGQSMNFDRESRAHFDDVDFGLRLAGGLCVTNGRYPVYVEGGYRIGVLGVPDTRSFLANVGVIL